MIRVKLREKAQAFCRMNGAPLTDLPTVPGVHALSLAMRYLEGGRTRFVEYVQMAMLNGHSEAEAWIMVYADLTPNERRVVSFDDVCAACGVKPSVLVGIVVSTAMEYGTDVANLISAAAHPMIVKKTIESAGRIDGEWAEIAFKDRLTLLQAAKFAPVPKGAAVHVHATASANSQAAAVMANEPSMPGFADDMRAIGQGRTPAAQLADGESEFTTEQRALETQDA